MIEIRFYPPLPLAPVDDSEVQLDSIDWRGVLARLPDEHDLEYDVAGVRARYYPSNLLVLVSDLLGELEALRSGQPHSVMISGYPVLDVEVENGMLRFYHAHERSKPGRSQVNGLVEIKEMEVAVRAALRDVWSLVKAVDRENRI